MTHQAPPVGQGSVVTVPREPTDEMLIAAQDAYADSAGSIGAVWDAMLSAAPHPDPVPPVVGWQALEALPERAGHYNIRSVTTYRWLPYKVPQGGRKGRWQSATEYGWRNDTLPHRGDWMPNLPIKPAPPAASVSPGMEKPSSASECTKTDDEEWIWCPACDGSGKIVEAARTEGANQHSACQHDCEDCDGSGYLANPNTTAGDRT